MENIQVKESINIKMEINTQEDLLTKRKKDMESTFSQKMDQDMKASGRKTRETEKENYTSKMEDIMMAIGLMIKDKDRDSNT